MSILNPHMMSFPSGPVRGPFAGGGGIGLSLANLLMKIVKNADGTMQDSIGLSVTDYDDVDPSVRPIFFINASALRPTADAIALAWASPWLSVGETMVGDETKGILALYKKDTAEATLSKAHRYVNGSFVKKLFKINVKTDNAGTTSSTSIGLPVEGTFDIDWGDGAVESVAAAVVGTLTTHDYGSAGTYTVKINSGLKHISFNNAGDKQKLTKIINLGHTGLNNLGSAFYGCTNLTTATCGHCDTSLVTSFSGMFHTCPNTTIIDVSGINTANATTLRSMFFNCSSVTSLDVSGFSTAKVTDMRVMFYNCSSVTSLDVSGFSTGLVSDMGFMFYGCSFVSDLDVSGFSFNAVTTMANMFDGCGIGAESYSIALITFANDVNTNSGPLNINASSQNGMTYNATVYGGIPFDNAVDARNYLVTATGSGGAGWTITGDALA